ncbi:MAG: glycosyltransferase family 2 protein [Parcubacteria group bacterium]|jgi:glycosyltransferase involved in cell wall biosynthesis
MQEKSGAYIILPVYNEARIINRVIEEITQAGYHRIIAVNDGSSDDTFSLLNQHELIVLRHLINRGKGAAIKTGVEAAKTFGAKVVVTMDADGQHNPQDIEKMLQAVQNGYDVALGSRPKSPKTMPLTKIVANCVGNIVTWLIFGLWVSDSQSGFRVYSQKAINLIDTASDRYEYESEVIKEIKRHKLKFIEIPIEERYTDYSKNKTHKQNFINGLKTAIKLILSA